MAVASLVCGIVSLVIGWWTTSSIVLGIVGILAGIAGIILSVKAKKAEPAKAGMCTAALVLSIIGLVCSTIMTIACGLLYAAANEVENALQGL